MKQTPPNSRTGDPRTLGRVNHQRTIIKKAGRQARVREAMWTTGMGAAFKSLANDGLLLLPHLKIDRVWWRRW